MSARGGDPVSVAAGDHFRVDGSGGEVLGMGLSPTCWAFVNTDVEIPILMASRREGKTTSGIAAIIRHRQRCTGPVLKAAIVRDSWTNLQRSVMETMREGHIRGWWDVEFREGGTEARLNGVEGSHVWFFGMDRPADANKFQSFEAGLIAIEEPAPAADLASGVPVDVFGMALSSLSQVDVPPRLQIMMNPPDEDHWVLEVASFLEEKHQTNLRVQQFWIPPGENPHLQAGYRERMRLGFEAANRQDLVARLVEGKIASVSMGEAVTPEFSDLHLFKDKDGKPAPAPMSPRWITVRSFDFGHCYEPSTDILTARGWTPVMDVAEGDAVATRHPETGVLEYQRITAKIVHHFSGELIGHRSQNVDFEVTPEHLIPVWRDSQEGRLGKWTKLPAEQLAGLRRPHAAVDLRAHWLARSPSTVGVLGWDAALYAEFMGWYLSEGCTRKGSVVIYQMTRRIDIETMLARTGLAWKPVYAYGDFVGWRTQHPALAASLAHLGRDAHAKRAPAELHALSRDDLRRFLHAFVEGDGHVRHRSWGPEVTAFTVSRALADDLQILALKAGWYARLRWQRAADSVITDRRGHQHVAHGTGGWVISFKQRAHRGHLHGPKFYRRQYDGPVACVTVPNGTVYVRRNGIAHWNGNSPCCVWAQVTPMGWLNVLGCVQGENMGIEELIEQEVLPWQAKFGMAPPAGRVDNFGKGSRGGYTFRDMGDAAARIREQTSTRRSAAWTLERMLRTSFEAAPIDWTSRRNAVKGALNRMVSGRPMVMFDSFECKPLIKALRGGWRFAKSNDGKVSRMAIKDKFSHSGDAFAYMCTILFPTYASILPPEPPRDRIILPPRKSFLGA